MKVKNIKYFVEFYSSLGISNCIVPNSRFEKPKDKKNNNIKIKYSKELENPNNETKGSKLKKLLDILQNSDCSLKEISTNLVFSDGNENSSIMIIGEAPGGEEDRIGRPFVGQAGKLLDKMLGYIDLNRKNVYLTNIVFWRPPGNRAPSKDEINSCLPHTLKHIEIIKPKLLVLLGNIASQSLLKTNEGITNLRTKSHLFLYNDLKIPTRTTFHPAYLLRNPIEKKKVWDDLLGIDDFINDKKI